MEDFLAIGGVIGFISGIITMFIFKSKNRSLWSGFFLGLLLGVIGIVIALVLSKQAKQEYYPRKCPHCDEGVKFHVKVCRHCGRDLPPAYTIPEKYTIDKLPPSEVNAIRTRNPAHNLRSGKRYLKQKKWHLAIASFQMAAKKSNVESSTYNEAAKILFEMLG